MPRDDEGRLDEGRLEDELVDQAADPSSDGLTATETQAPPIQLLMRMGDHLPRATPPGYTVATDLLAELLDGVETPHAFVPPIRHTGLCRVCGATAALTFEHVPPRSAGNDRRARRSPSLPVLTSDQPLAFPETGWTPAQRGVGGYVLCEPCNSLIGARYIPEYGKLAAALTERVDGAFAALGHAVGRLDLDLTGWALGDVARAGLVTVMDVAVHDRLLRRYPELTNVVRQPEVFLS